MKSPRPVFFFSLTGEFKRFQLMFVCGGWYVQTKYYNFFLQFSKRFSIDYIVIRKSFLEQ